MIFEIYFFSKTLKYLEKLDMAIKLQILKKLKQLRENPELGKPLSNSLSDKRSLHIGNFRVIYLLQDNKIIIVAIGHRKNIYENFYNISSSDFRKYTLNSRKRIVYRVNQK